MTEPTESLRRIQLAEVNAVPRARESLETNYGQVWANTEELARDFDVVGFLAPYVVVRRKADRQLGSLAFQNDPRLYFGWAPDHH
ncbi:MAG: hypothetical protein JNM56_00735 [Planctomycetia bacterium]|nr:hypothetical protein [Planctomycetia bacterium]